MPCGRPRPVAEAKMDCQLPVRQSPHKLNCVRLVPDCLFPALFFNISTFAKFKYAARKVITFIQIKCLGELRKPDRNSDERNGLR
jgi:hypothetical protein